MYGDYAAQPDLGLLNRREGILGLANLSLRGIGRCLEAPTTIWRPGSSPWGNSEFGYVDDCLILALNYSQSYAYSSSPTTINNTVMLQLTLRTLGGTSIATLVGSSVAAP